MPMVRKLVLSGAVVVLAGIGCTGPDQKARPAGPGQPPGPSPSPAKSPKEATQPAHRPSRPQRNVRIAIHDPGTAAPKEAVKAAATAIRRIDELTNASIEASDIARINREGAEKEVPISAETLTAIERALYWTQRTGGAFDLTAGPLIRLWRDAAAARNLPTDEQVQQALGLKGASGVGLGRSRQTVRLAWEGMQLDPGGLAVGYAMDVAARELRSAGVRCAELRMEDTLVTFGQQPSGGKTTVPIEHPARRGKQLGSFPVTNSAVATVRPKRGSFNLDGRWYSGIISPLTGRPTENVVTVTVVATNAADAQALALALFALGPDEGQALMDKLPTAEALMLSVDPAKPGGFRTVITRGLQSIMSWEIKLKR